MKIDKNTRDRFFSFVEKQDNGCWLWMGSRDRKGYGRIYVNGKQFMAHRFMWEVICGRDIPQGYELHHRCRRRDCCNPKHLILVTHQQNMWLASDAGAWSGPANGNCKRTEEQVHVIRALRTLNIPMPYISALMAVPLRSCYAVLEGGGSWKQLQTPTRYMLLKVYEDNLNALADHVLNKKVRPPKQLIRRIELLLPTLPNDFRTTAEIIFQWAAKLPPEETRLQATDKAV